ncbi:hypothetical protein LAZ67_15000338 [Cordylochernes scorpioides]|uniref:Uncharacterized protein n=1 Tax=Cordylochernes scorpioides TaxID=51811 RepID=A0ABY6LC41_9ARAC|nr:hypothetical protein LAZ67_15000338 [Cordylochernes scorpioides]
MLQKYQKRIPPAHTPPGRQTVDHLLFSCPAYHFHRTKHYKGMAIHPDGTRTYKTCNNCPGVELTPTHIFSCLAMAAALQKIDMDPEQKLYTPKIVDIETAVIEMRGDI